MSHLTYAANSNGTVAITYNSVGRVAGATDVFNQVVGYNYDANGNRTGMTLNGSSYARYSYDQVNRLTNLSDNSNQSYAFSYDAVNRLTGRGAPNGITSTYAYDGLNRLTALTHANDGAPLISNQYAYNNANNIATWTNASGNHAYVYDATDRLTSATNSAQPNENYSYDPLGNRTASHLSATYGYQPFNKLASTANATYSYDNNGDLLSKTDSSGTTSFSYDGENRLKQVTLPGGLTVSYKYDALGRRIQRTTGSGANERYVYDGADVLTDLSADSSVAAVYLNGPGIDNHLRQTSATTAVSYFLTDHLGSTSALADGAGNIVEQEAYDSFGNSAGSTRTRYGYTGRERDPDTGLIYYRARWYDPGVGRFVSEDPIGLLGGFNLYEYAYDNPLRFVDPLGLQWQQAALAGGGTLTGAASSGALGAVAAAAAPYAAVGAAYGATLYGARKLGEAIADAHWNPFTHVTDLPQPRAVPRCNAKPKAQPIPLPAPTRECPPCPAPPPPQIHRVPPSRPHFPCPGDHWHFFVYNQNPVTCTCYPQRKFGGCCGQPGAPC